MPSKWRWTKIPVQSSAETQPVPIVRDAVVSVRGWGEGRMIPLLILDTTTRPDLNDMIRVHQHPGPGDATSGWMRHSRWVKARISLLITTTKPTRCTILVEFDLAKWAGTVDQIVMTQALYIQPGRPGDRRVTTMVHERLLIEIPTREFREDWDRIFREATVAEFRRKGLSRAKAKQAAGQFMEGWRQALSLRLRSD